MENRRFVTVDGNEATANIAHLCNEVMAIYPITPSSGLGELPDAWAAAGRKNIFGTVPDVVEMQSEAGAAGAVHGALQAGALTTTFTASQGLLLMIPNMFKIAGELTATVFHVTARTVATHALSIFGDHGDVMACRSTGWAMLSSASVQESQDMAMVAHSATLEARVPFLHFYDGFRISHEVNKIEQLTEDDVRAMIDMDLVAAHRRRALSPERPKLRGTAQNPDVFFQAREACNPFYAACAGIVQKHMDKFAKLTGRQYHLFDYVGAADADRVIVIMGSGIGVVEETVDKLVPEGQKVGLLKVRLFRPWDSRALVAALPKTVKKIAVLDRTKEPGAAGEPLYQDVVTALAECWAEKLSPRPLGEGTGYSLPRVIGGRYGLSSKEFTPAMVAAVYEELTKAQPKQQFTVGIRDDVTNLSLDYDPNFSTEKDDVTRAVFFGLGSDGTVSANRNSVKIVGENTPLHAQGYFVYDSRKAGSVTTSHVRFSPRPIKGSYLVHRANFVACHQSQFLPRIDMLSMADAGATFLLNSVYGPDQVWDRLPAEVQRQIIDKKLKFYVVDAYDVARTANMGVRINTIMQTCFFKLAKVIPADEAITQIKDAIKNSYGKKGGGKIVEQNFAAVDGALASLHEVKYPQAGHFEAAHGAAGARARPRVRQRRAGHDDRQPRRRPARQRPAQRRHVPHGHDPVREAEHRPGHPHLGPEDLHAVRAVFAGLPPRDDPPEGLRSGPAGRAPGRLQGRRLQGQGVPRLEVRRAGSPRRLHRLRPVRRRLPRQGQGESQAQGDRHGVEAAASRPRAGGLRLLYDDSRRRPLEGQARHDQGLAIAAAAVRVLRGLRRLRRNALCQAPYAVLRRSDADRQRHGLLVDLRRQPALHAVHGQPRRPRPVVVELAVRRLRRVRPGLPPGRRSADEVCPRTASPAVGAVGRRAGLRPAEQQAGDGRGDCRAAGPRGRAEQAADGHAGPDAKNLLASSDYLIRKSIWSFGGDGWAYDIGFGGMDHVFASGRDVNILVLDTEVYSNTGGQASKSTFRGAVAKFAAGGKGGRKKDLGMIAMSYGDVFVGSISMGANPMHALRTIRAAESYRGTSLLIAFSHCIGWGIDMAQGMNVQKEAVACGYWPLWSFDPRQEAHPFQLASKKPVGTFKDFAMKEARFAMLARSKPDESVRLLALGQRDINARYHFYEQLAGVDRATVVAEVDGGNGETKPKDSKEVEA